MCTNKFQIVFWFFCNWKVCLYFILYLLLNYIHAIISTPILASLSLPLCSYRRETWCWNLGKLDRHQKRKQARFEKSLGDCNQYDFLRDAEDEFDFRDDFYDSIISSDRNLRPQRSVVSRALPVDCYDVCI